MKKQEQRVLDTFSDASMAIDPKFKKNLRQHIIKGQPQKHWWMIPKLALVPLVMLLIIGFALFAGTQNASAPSNNPFQPKSVSAQELIEKSKEASKAFDGSKYTYFTSFSKSAGGPWWQTCHGGYTDSPKNVTSEFYVYNSESEHVQASYIKEIGDGNVLTNQSVYDTTPRDDSVPGILMGTHSLADEFQSIGISGRPSYLLVDKDGNRVSTDTVTVTKQNGKDVYVIYIKTNQPYMSPLECVSPDATWTNKEDPDYGKMITMPDINKLVIDATTYRTVEYDAYVKSVSPENLIESSTSEFTVEKLDQASAISKMTSAGFDRAHALPEYPGGHD